MANGIEPMHVVVFFVINEIAVIFLAVREDLEKDQRADDGVENFSIVECLVDIGDIFIVNAFAFGGVVFDFDREVTTDCFDEDFVLDGNVGELAATLHIAVGTDPLKFLLRWKFVFVVEAVAEVS